MVTTAYATTAGPLACPGCGGTGIRRIGRIPAADVFAGRTLPTPLSGGNLEKCVACELMFRHPRLPKSALDELYRAGADGTWSATAFAARADWLRAAAGIRRYMPDAQSVLDVGCFDGQFLTGLHQGGAHFGIEIHAEAARRATAAGVQVIGADFAALAQNAGRFDVATAFDVIEHVYNPADLLSRMLEAVRPGGIIVISTGNTRAWSWRMLGARYWYCSIPEHVSFVCPQWLARQATTNGARIEAVTTFSHDTQSRTRGLYELVANLGYRIAPAAVAGLRRAGLGRHRGHVHPDIEDAPPRWITARDHLLAIIRRGAPTP